MGKMKELYTIGQELSLDFEEAADIVTWLNEALYAEKPAEKHEEEIVLPSHL